MLHPDLTEMRKALHTARDTLGCSLGALQHDYVARAGDLTVLHKGAPGTRQMQVATPAQDRGMIVGLSLKSGHRRRIREGSRRHDRIFERNAIYIREFDVDYSATAEGAFEFFLFELPARSDLRLRPTNDAVDPLLGALARRMCGWIAQPHLQTPLFLQEAGERVMEHLAAVHADTRRLRRPARLSPTEVARAKDLLMSGSMDQIHLDDVARALNMPRGRFFRGFRETTGVSPYQWLIDRRLENARLLLRLTREPLVDIALACGFSDQSHFTRMFQRSQGVSPARWRRSLN